MCRPFIFKFRIAFLWFIVSVLILPACKQKEAVVLEQSTPEAISLDNNFNSLIQGKIIKRYKANEDYQSVHREHFSEADVVILDILRMGQNYHGQFNKGDTLRIFFNFTLEDTKELFPNLNKAMPGLKENDVFKAELDEKESSQPAYSVYLYQLINSK